MTLERTGLPTGTIVTDAFAEYGRRLTKLQSMEGLPMIVLPHPIAAKSEQDVRRIAQAAFERVVGALLVET